MREVRKRGSNMVRANICVNLFIAEFVLLVGLDATGNEAACKLVAILLQYFFLATFSWSALEALNFHFLLVKVWQAIIS